jgi:formylglycine-generating enzyme required for sulfatase activity
LGVEIITNTREVDGMEVVYVSGGTFQMGSSEAEIDAAFQQCKQDRGAGECSRERFEDEAPPHAVTLDSFWVDKTEVTNTQFAAFLNERGNQKEGGATWMDLNDETSLIENAGGAYRPKSGYDSHPVIEVSWYGAAAYCEWVGGRLPTEAEWEYAARGQQGDTYPWGDDAPTCDLAQFEACSGTTLPVGSFPNAASRGGVQDMAGNVWEWVDDWYDGYASTTAQTDPTGRETGDKRVLRGGSWDWYAYNVRSANRFSSQPERTHHDVGFRCVSAATPFPS